MNYQNKKPERLATLLNEVAVDEGFHPTSIGGVNVFRSTESSLRSPAIYEPVIIIVGQGQKRAYLDNKVYVYDPLNYLVLSVPLPLECEWEASPEEPLLIVTIDVEPAMLGEIILDMDESLPPVGPLPRAISTTSMNEELSGAVIRLLEHLKSPLDSCILGRQTVREIVYRVLLGNQGGSLRALANRDGHFIRIARVLKQIHTDYADPFTVENMAKQANMSVAAFHQNFKSITGNSPLQYLKRIRLDRARNFMAHDGYNASTAAKAVGYESPSQFSREFKRLFGITPVEETKQTRTR